MEKQIFIPADNNTPLTFLNLCIQEKSIIRLKTPAYLCVLGLVNQQLDDKANAKEILSVQYVEEINLLDEERNGYLITYLESEMIATKSDLENLFGQADRIAGENERYENLTFADWFNENFSEKSN